MSQSDEPAAAGLPFAPRQASRDDLHLINELNAAAYAVYRPRMDRPAAPVRHDYTAEIEAGQVWLVIAPDGSGQLLGQIVLIPGNDRMLIENIAVAPAAQRRGLGRRLMAFAEQQAAARGLSRITLYTNVVMTENIVFYAKLGYRETARLPGHGYTRVFMEKHLG